MARAGRPGPGSQDFTGAGTGATIAGIVPASARARFLALLLALALPLPAAAGDEICGEDALVEADEADLRLRQAGSCRPDELAVLRTALEKLRECADELPGEPVRWVFPVEGASPGEAIGGSNGSGYIANRPGRCYALDRIGHPAHDIFVHDPNKDSRDAGGEPFPVRAVEDGIVLVARDGWTPGNPARGGNYVMLYLPARGRIAYYAHLESLAVRAGELVRAGDRLGMIGRTGLNAWPRRSPTHLHFGLWDARTLSPVNSFPLLRQARR